MDEREMKGEMKEEGGWGVRDGHALLRRQSGVFRDKCESVVRDNLFPSASPVLYLPPFLALLSSPPFPHEDGHISYSVGRLKIQSWEGGGSEEKEREYLKMDKMKECL